MLSQLAPAIYLWQVATILLCLAFGYDIFWVFLSPYIMGKSVMVEVRRWLQGGGGGEALVAGESGGGGGEALVSGEKRGGGNEASSVLVDMRPLGPPRVV